MKKTLRILLFFLVCFSATATTQAYEMSRILLPPVLDATGYRSPELNAALLVKVRDHFKFPRYDVIPAQLPAGKEQIDQAWLEKQTTAHKADGIVVVEIKELRSYTRIISDDEIVDETTLALVLHFFDLKTGKSGKIKADRSVTQIASVHSGALPLSVETVVELLKRLEKVFPRSFPQPSVQQIRGSIS